MLVINEASIRFWFGFQKMVDPAGGAWKRLKKSGKIISDIFNQKWYNFYVSDLF
jgi:hypothetical protein